MKPGKLGKLGLIIFILGLANLAAAQSIAIETQATKFIKALGYLNTYSNSTSKEFKIVIVYHKGVSDAVVAAARAAFEAHKSEKVANGKTLLLSLVSFAEEGELKSALEKEKASAIYITAGNESYVPNILMISRAKRILSIAGEVDYVRRGATLGLDTLNGKITVVISLAGCHNEGVEFSSRLLDMADVRF